MDYRLLAALPLVALGACTSRLELAPVTPLADGTHSAATVPSGVPYALYYDRYEITTTYTVANCDTLELEVEPTVSAVLAEPDPVQSYVIDPNSLARPFKTSSVALEYHPDGSVAAINAKADDRSAETFGALAKSVAGIVKIAVAPGGPAITSVGCNAATRKAFDAYTAQQGVVKSAKNAIDLAQTEFDAAKAQIDASSGVVARPVQSRFNNAFMGLQVATTRLASAKAQLAKLAKAISVSTTVLWPDSGSETSGTLRPPPELGEKLGEWADVSPNTQPANYSMTIALEPTQAGPLAVTSGGMPQLDRKALARGIPYRSPARGRLVIRSAFIGPDNQSISSKLLFEKGYSVRQLGRVFQLPCISRPFTSIGCTLAFDAKGQLTKAGAENTKAPAEAAAGLLGSVVESGSGAAEAVRAANERRRNSPTTVKQDELAQLELDAKLDAARKVAAGPDPTAQQIKEKQILEYETDLKLITARRALADGQSLVTP